MPEPTLQDVLDKLETMDAQLERVGIEVKETRDMVTILDAKVDSLDAKIEETRDTVGSLSLTVTRPRRTGTGGDD